MKPKISVNTDEVVVRRGTFFEYLQEQFEQMPGGIREVTRFNDLKMIKGLRKTDTSETELLSLARNRMEEIRSKLEKTKNIKDVLPTEIPGKGNSLDVFLKAVDNAI